MVSYQVLHSIHSRLCEIFAKDDPFGGLNVIAVGDLYQLAPVNGQFVFSNSSRGRQGIATHLWRDLFKIVELKENMRQRNDTDYSSLLNRLRTGCFTAEDIDVLKKRIVGSNSEIDLTKAPFKEALRLFPRVADCDTYNEEQLYKLGSQVHTMTATHVLLECRRLPHGAVNYGQVPEQLIPEDDKVCAGLPRQVKLALGAEVMLRRNIKCGEGLVNGARGTVVGFKWSSNNITPGELPREVYVKFHDSKVGQLSMVPVNDGEQEAVPIEPLSAKFHGLQGTVIQRTQIPLILCWAATVHKVQGLSMDAAVLDIRDKIFQPGMTYVALSRVRTLSGVALVDMSARKITANKRIQEEMDRLRQSTGESLEDMDTSNSSEFGEMETVTPNSETINVITCRDLTLGRSELICTTNAMPPLIHEE